MPSVFNTIEKKNTANPVYEAKIDIHLDKIEGEVPIMSTYIGVDKMRSIQVSVYLV